MKALLRSNHTSAAAATEHTLQMLMQQVNGTAELARNPDGTFAFDPDGWITVQCSKPEFLAWAALKQGYVASMKTDPGETASLARMCAGEPMIIPLPEVRRWPDIQGMKQNIAPVINNACRALTSQGLEAVGKVGHSFVLEEFMRHLWELGDRFYSGELEVVDEFLQLYCLDRQRKEKAPGGPTSAIPPKRKGAHHFIARDERQINEFCARHGIDQSSHVRTEADLLAVDTCIYRLPGATLEGDLERKAVARRLHIINVSAKAMEGIEPI